ncbi:hypothetical protein ABW20_dc0109012 [Dactylellina cionopaga]|nr:hypothetical protein ABW20_dc0109012 [Dactylellina cionopaga]
MSTVTETSTESTTSTATVYATETDFSSITVTQTVLSTLTVGAPDVVITIIQPIGNTVKKRVVPPTTVSLPAYASPCSDIVRFTSACSCIGITTALTITLPTPVTTITQTTTASFSTETTITQDTTTVTTAVSTTTVTSIVATRTLGSGATTTVTATTFRLRYNYQTNPASVDYYLTAVVTGGQTILVNSVVAPNPAASRFSIDTSGRLIWVLGSTTRYSVQPASDPDGFYTFELATSLPAGYNWLPCNINPLSFQFTCNNNLPNYRQLVEQYINGSPSVAVNRDLASYNAHVTMCRIIVVTAVP